MLDEDPAVMEWRTSLAKRLGKRAEEPMIVKTLHTGRALDVSRSWMASRSCILNAPVRWLHTRDRVSSTCGIFLQPFKQLYRQTVTNLEHLAVFPGIRTPGSLLRHCVHFMVIVSKELANQFYICQSRKGSEPFICPGVSSRRCQSPRGGKGK